MHLAIMCYTTVMKWILKNYLDAHNITPHALAVKSGLSTATIYPMAHNNAKRVSLDVLQRLADTLTEMTGEKITSADLLEVE